MLNMKYMRRITVKKKVIINCQHSKIPFKLFRMHRKHMTSESKRHVFTKLKACYQLVTLDVLDMTGYSVTITAQQEDSRPKCLRQRNNYSKNTLSFILCAKHLFLYISTRDNGSGCFTPLYLVKRKLTY